MASFFSVLADIIFPPRCVFCHHFLKAGPAGSVCLKCVDSLPYTAGAPIPVRDVELCVACLTYKDDVRRAIHRFKFGGVSGYATTFGHLLAENIRRNFADRYDLITWVPVSTKRRSERGYDQAMLIAMAAAIELDDVAVDTIKKVVDTPSQSGLSEPERRRANVLGVFQVVDPELVDGKRVLLIDDIVTSGSTLSECAAMLKAAGAVSVCCAVLADASEK